MIDLQNQVDANQTNHETFIAEKVGHHLCDLSLSQPANIGRAFFIHLMEDFSAHPCVCSAMFLAVYADCVNPQRLDPLLSTDAPST